MTTASVSSPRRRRILWLGLVAVAAVAVVAVVAWLVFRGDGGSTESQPPAVQNAPVLVTAAALKTIAKVVPQPVYWAGPEAGAKYELTRAADGNVYVRYLPEGVQAGEEQGEHLIVVTYPFKGAFAALQKVGGGNEQQVAGGGIAVPSDSDPTSVHVAFPNVDYQVEVYDPSPEKALEVATSGRIRSAG